MPQLDLDCRRRMIDPSKPSFHRWCGLILPSCVLSSVSCVMPVRVPETLVASDPIEVIRIVISSRFFNRATGRPSASPPASHAALIPPLLPLLPQIKLDPRLPIPAHPIRHLALRRRAPSRSITTTTRTHTHTSAIRAASAAFEEALLHGEAHVALLLHALRETLVQARGGKGCERVVHVGLALAPLALERVRGQQLGLGGGALAREVRREHLQVGREAGVLREGEGEVGVGGGERGVCRRGGVGEATQELGRGEQRGEVLGSVVVVQRGQRSPSLKTRENWARRGGSSRLVLQHARQPPIPRVWPDVRLRERHVGQQSVVRSPRRRRVALLPAPGHLSLLSLLLLLLLLLR